MSEEARDRRRRAVIRKTAAQLFVFSIKASCDFFTQSLGFSIAFV
jgi:hypothetical protein